MHIRMHKWGETDLCKFRSSYDAIQIFSCWKNFPVLHHCFKDSIKKTYTWFFGLIKSRFSEPEMFLIYTRVSKTTPAMVINFTDNDDIQRYSPFLSSCVCFLFEHSVLHNVGWPLPILPIMAHISIMGLEGKGRRFGNMQGEGRLSWKEKKTPKQTKNRHGSTKYKRLWL